MTNHFFTHRKTLQCLHEGPLGTHVVFRQNSVRLLKTILAHSLSPGSLQNRACLKGF